MLHQFNTLNVTMLRFWADSLHYHRLQEYVRSPFSTTLPTAISFAVSQVYYDPDKIRISKRNVTFKIQTVRAVIKVGRNATDSVHHLWLITVSTTGDGGRPLDSWTGDGSSDGQ